MAKKFLYMLAPIEDVTDSCFRSLCNADLTFTEMARIEALEKRNASTLQRIKMYDEMPTAIQIIGNNAELLEKFLSGFSPEKGFAGFNLNLGCPSENFVRDGLGCAMIKRIAKTQKVIDIIKDHGYGTSVKMRLGLNSYEKEKKVYLNLINKIDADFFVVHARHGDESYKKKADWSILEELKNTGKNIVANGDIKTKEDVERFSDLMGVMIGRAALANPLIFAELKGLFISKKEIMEEYSRLVRERNPPEKYKRNLMRYLEKA